MILLALNLPPLHDVALADSGGGGADGPARHADCRGRQNLQCSVILNQIFF
jgi:hypothetical protein